MVLTWRQSWPAVYTLGVGGTHPESDYFPEASAGAGGASEMTGAGGDGLTIFQVLRFSTGQPTNC